MSNFFRKVANLKFFQWLKRVFGRFFKYLGYILKCFKTLVMMQLKERLDISFKADVKGSLTKMLLYFLAFGVLVGVIAVLFIILGKLSVFGLGIVPVAYFNVIIYLVIILNLLSVIHKLTNSLYFSQDNQVLLTYPCNNGVIFFSKLAVFYVMELVKSFVMLAPLFIAYGIVNSLPWFFYPWMIVAFLLLSLVTVVVSAVISLPYMYVLSFLKKYQNIQSLLIIAIAITASVFIFIGLEKIPANLEINLNWATVYLPKFTDTVNKIELYSKPFFYVPVLFMGYRGYQINGGSPRYLKIFSSLTGPIVGVCFAIIVVGVVIAYFVSRPLFFKMASKPFEYSKKFIPHDFKLSKDDENIYKFGFKPVFDHELSKKERKSVIYDLSRLLRKLNHEEKLFLRGKIAEKRIQKFLKKYSKNYKFELVNVEEIDDIGFIIQTRLNIPFLVLVKGQPRIHLHCYDPNYLKKKNHKTNLMLSNLVKDLLVDLRTPGTVASMFLLFIVTPLAITVLNTTFSAINTSFQGKTYTIVVNMLIILLIFLASNVSMASIYSREGKASYLIKASPSNYMMLLTWKLVIRAAIMTGSLILTIVMYSHYTDVKFMKWGYMFFAIYFLYLGHLIWCAELDYMKPQDKLYSEVGANVSNPNETMASVYAFVLAGLGAFFTYFFLDKDSLQAFSKLFFIAIAFFGARLLLFLLRIKGYGTSRQEGREN